MCLQVTGGPCQPDIDPENLDKCSGPVSLFGSLIPMYYVKNEEFPLSKKDALFYQGSSFWRDM